MTTRDMSPLRGVACTAASVASMALVLSLVAAGCKSSDAADPPAPAASGATVAQPVAPAQALPAPPPGPPAPSDVASPPPDAEKSASGLVTKVVTPGDGTQHVEPGMIFVTGFTAWDRAGKVTSHVDHAEITLDSLAPGWAEGARLMVPGETRRMWIPAALTRKPGVPDPRPVVDLTVDLTLEYIGRLKLRGAPVRQAAAPAEPAAPEKVGAANGQPHHSANTTGAARKHD